MKAWNYRDFIFDLPVWALQSNDPTEPLLIKLETDHGELCFPIFTDENLADRYAADIADTVGNVVPMELFSAESVCVFLDFCIDQETTHVAIDPGESTGRFIPIGEFRIAVTS